MSAVCCKIVVVNEAVVLKTLVIVNLIIRFQRCFYLLIVPPYSDTHWIDIKPVLYICSIFQDIVFPSWYFQLAFSSFLPRVCIISLEWNQIHWQLFFNP